MGVCSVAALKQKVEVIQERKKILVCYFFKKTQSVEMMSMWVRLRSTMLVRSVRRGTGDAIFHSSCIWTDGYGRYPPTRWIYLKRDYEYLGLNTASKFSRGRAGCSSKATEYDGHPNPSDRRLSLSPISSDGGNITKLRIGTLTSQGTEIVAFYFASLMGTGDCFLLRGEVGAGKSFFSRAFVRAALDDEEAPVPSPTYLLQNMYPTEPSIYHFDLYRLNGKRSDLARLDLEHSFRNAVALIEWPERLTEDFIPSEYLEVHIDFPSAPETQDKFNEAAIDTMEYSELETIEYDSDLVAEEGGKDSVRKISTAFHSEWRILEFVPKGQRWEQQLQELKTHVHSRGAELGLFILSSD